MEGTWKGQSKREGQGSPDRGRVFHCPLLGQPQTVEGPLSLPSLKGKKRVGTRGGEVGGSMSTPELMLVVDFRKLPSRRLNLISFKRSKS